ncbi:MAG: 50S ribosomal protein L17 [Lentisphaeria bacterium]|nr:50S ribosomal protein L17 [Lentisphaeria bacterium]
MRHRVDTFKIGRSGAHRRAMLANMVSSLFANGRIETTVVKAKAAASFAERLITLGKKGELHHRRIAFSRLRSKDAVKTLFDEIAPKFADRQGGYTRIFKLGQRRGDAAETCILMLVDASAAEAPAKKAEAPAKEPEKQEAKAE